MANKQKFSVKNTKKMKGQYKKEKVQTEYQRERDAAKNAKHRKKQKLTKEK